MHEGREDRAATSGRLEYRAPEITDLGSVVELTEAAGANNSATFDGAGYNAPGHS
jgi:hypothetical protein